MDDVGEVVLMLLSAALVGSVGLLPILVMPAHKLKAKAEDLLEGTALRAMLGCACGGLLANVFLHLLPEAMTLASKASFERARLLHELDNSEQVILWHHPHQLNDPHVVSGLFALAGILFFFGLEKLAATLQHPQSEARGSPTDVHSSPAPGAPMGSLTITEIKGISPQPVAYLNILVNFLDNFTHGLAVATSYGISVKTGILTTAAVVLHEIPHEVGDYAILLKSGFSIQEAIRGQMMTSVGSVAGALAGVWLDAKAFSSAVLPFTAGGFAYIALVNLVPELLTPRAGWPWWLDLVSVMVGIGLVAVTMLLD